MGVASASSSPSGSPSALGPQRLAWRRAEQRQVAEAASAGRSRAQKRVMWSFDADTSTWMSGWNVGAQTFESWAWESLARGGICGASAESALYDAGEVAAPGDDD